MSPPRIALLPGITTTQADRVGVRSSAAWGVRVARGCGLAIVYVLLVAGRALGAAQEC